MVSTHLLFPSFPVSVPKLFVTVPIAPITTDITVTFKFYSFFQFPSKVQVLIFLFAFFQLYSVVCRDGKIYSSAGPLFCWLIISGGISIIFTIKLWTLSENESAVSVAVNVIRNGIQNLDESVCVSVRAHTL